MKGLPVAEMPFADEAAGVARLFQEFRRGDFRRIDADAVARINDLRRAGPVRIAPGHEREPRGRAALMHVKTGELHAIPCEGIDVRRLDVLAAKTGQVTIAQVIGEDENDVGFLRRTRDGRFVSEHHGQGEEEDSDEVSRCLHGLTFSHQRFGAVYFSSSSSGRFPSNGPHFSRSA